MKTMFTLVFGEAKANDVVIDHDRWWQEPCYYRKLFPLEEPKKHQAPAEQKQAKQIYMYICMVKLYRVSNSENNFQTRQFLPSALTIASVSGNMII